MPQLALRSGAAARRGAAAAAAAGAPRSARAAAPLAPPLPHRTQTLPAGLRAPAARRRTQRCAAPARAALAEAPSVGVLSPVTHWTDPARTDAPPKRLQTQVAPIAANTTVIRSLDMDRRVTGLGCAAVAARRARCLRAHPPASACVCGACADACTCACLAACPTRCCAPQGPLRHRVRPQRAHPAPVAAERFSLLTHTRTHTHRFPNPDLTRKHSHATRRAGRHDVQQLHHPRRGQGCARGRLARQVQRGVL
jgi:hypothetical protein